MLTSCVDWSSIFKPGNGWRRNSTGDTVQTHGLVENHWTFSRSIGTDGWRNCRGTEGRFLSLETFYNWKWGTRKFKKGKARFCCSLQLEFRQSHLHLKDTEMGLFNFKVSFFVLPWTTTLKSLLWFPASLVATHWKRAVSETWAREMTRRRPPAAIHNPSPCRNSFPSLCHLGRN